VLGAWPVLIASLGILAFAHLDSLTQEIARRFQARKRARAQKR